MIRRVLSTPLGPMSAAAEGECLTRLQFGAEEETEGTPSEAVLLERLARELEEYAAGRRRHFTLPLRPAGTPFQRRVWEALQSIPYGECRSYGEIAAALGRPGAARAVGGACGKNPIAVLIPCHRVVGRDGALTGYSAQRGVERKRALLELEGAAARLNCSRPSPPDQKKHRATSRGTTPMNIQIFGKSKCFDTKKAQRYFKERRIRVQNIDLLKYGMSKGELTSVVRAVGLDALIDPKHPDATLLSYLAYDQQKLEHLLEDPRLLKTPIVRNGKKATVGYAPEVWKQWEAEEKP